MLSWLSGIGDNLQDECNFTCRDDECSIEVIVDGCSKAALKGSADFNQQSIAQLVAVPCSQDLSRR